MARFLAPPVNTAMNALSAHIVNLVGSNDSSAEGEKDRKRGGESVCVSMRDGSEEREGDEGERYFSKGDCIAQDFGVNILIIILFIITSF